METAENTIASGDNGGHVWDSIPHVTLEYRPDGNYPEHPAQEKP